MVAPGPGRRAWQRSRSSRSKKRTWLISRKGPSSTSASTATGRLFLGPKLKSLPGPAEEFYLSAAAAETATSTWAPGTTPRSTGSTRRQEREDLQGRAAGCLRPAGGRQRRRDRWARRPTAGCTASARTTRSANCSIPTRNSSGTWPRTSRATSSAPWAIPAPSTASAKAGTVENLFMAEDSHIVSLHVTARQCHPGRQRRPRHPLRDQEPQGQGAVRFPPGRDQGHHQRRGGQHLFRRGQERSGPAVDARRSRSARFSPRAKAPTKKPPIREKSILYCLQADGSGRNHLVLDGGTDLFRLLRRPSKAVIIGTGNSGRVYRVDKHGTYAQVCESDSAQVFSITANGKGYFLVANNTAGITPGRERPERQRHVLFRGVRRPHPVPLRAPGLECRPGQASRRSPSRCAWGIPTIPTSPGRAGRPRSTTRKIRTSTAAGYRFLQAKIVLSSANPTETPYLRGYRIHYLANNLKPEIGQILVQKPGEKKPVADTTPPKKYLHRLLGSDRPQPGPPEFQPVPAEASRGAIGCCCAAISRKNGCTWTASSSPTASIF